MLTVWKKILSAIDRINITLQKAKLTIDVAVKHLQSLLKILENFREQGINEALSDSKNKAEVLGIETEFPKVRLQKKKLLPGEIAKDEFCNISEENKLLIMIKNVIDNTLIELRQRFNSMENIVQDFSFLDPTIIYSSPMENLKRAGVDLFNKY